MAALTAERQTKSRALGPKKKLKLAAVKVYAGGMAMMDSAGYARPAAASVSNNGVVGIFTETVDNSGGAAGDKKAEIQAGEFLMAGTTMAQSVVGDLVYAEEDQTVDETQGTNEPRAGICTEFVSSTSVWVKMEFGTNV